ncbi:Rieske [2Fe-2S] iron-sulfur domain-containing protein, partial [Dunaliella salina]
MLARSKTARTLQKCPVGHPNSARVVPVYLKSVQDRRRLEGARLPTTRTNVATLQSTSLMDEAEKRDAWQEVAVPSTTSADIMADISHVWKRVWIPASPVNMLEKTKPNKVTLLGKDLVAWFDSAHQSWEVVEDRCPHRFAPLSEGRIVDGQLMCSYHGWRFGKGGECTDIPQLPPGPPKEAACKQRKACASAYPSTVSDGLLFVWMDNSPEGLLASLQTTPFKSDAPSKFDWIMAQNPNDYTFWLEQGLDPSHAPYLHHGMGGFEMKNATELLSRAVPEVTLEGGFTWRHQGYETRNRDLMAARQFIPPFAIETRYNKQATKASSTQAFTSLVVPVRPGVTRS